MTPSIGPPFVNTLKRKAVMRRLWSENGMVTLSSESYRIRYGTAISTESITAPASSMLTAEMYCVWAGSLEKVNVVGIGLMPVMC